MTEEGWTVKENRTLPSAVEYPRLIRRMGFSLNRDAASSTARHDG